jgi:adenine-specific DNA-methyltransferase
MDGKSLDIKQGKIERLKELLPEVFTEEKIDWEKLKAALSEDVEFKNERYVLNWAGKSDAFKVLQAPTTATLVPVRNESIDFNDTGNIFIEGENLEVLKVLQKSYFGKIKMIDIDPPYNTGNDNFIYPDRFSETKEEYLERIGDKDELGYITREGLFRKNSKDSGHYHSNWLSMMYPRLFLARNLLREDGVIFVSIDDNEVHNLRLLMNEVFGEENFVDCIIWKKRYGGGAKEKFLVSLHEYVLVYAKNLAELPEIFIPLSQKSIDKYYKLKDKNFSLRGAYRTHPLEATKSMGERKNLVYPILAPDGTEVMPKRQWLWGKERAQKALHDGELEFIKGKDRKWTVHTKQYLKNENGEIRKDKAFSIVDDVYTQHGTNEIIDLFGNAQIFSFPKPTAFINFLITIGINDKTGIILDFFSGSCTTAHAALDLNKQDNGNRKFICVQLPEKSDKKSEAFKAGYKTIADIGKERIRRVIKKIKKDDEGKLPFEKTKQDIGFKVFKLQPSNFKIWQGDGIENGRQLEKHLQLHLDSIKKDAGEEYMLYELLLKSGRDLNSKIENTDNYYRINDSEMVVALSKIDEKIVDSILEVKPQIFITLDKLFENNDQLKTNTLLQMKDAGIEFKVV